MDAADGYRDGLYAYIGEQVDENEYDEIRCALRLYLRRYRPSAGYDAAKWEEYDGQIRSSQPPYFWSGVICHDLSELIREIRREYDKGLKGSFDRVDAVTQMSEADGENGFLIDSTVRSATYYYGEDDVDFG